MTNVEPAVVRRFFYHVGRAHAQKEHREQTKNEIRTHLERVKEISTSPTIKKPELQEALLALERKLDAALANENSIISSQAASSKTLSSVTKKLKELDEKIEVRTELEKSRSDRFENLEKEIDVKVDQNSKEVKLIESKVGELEGLYHKVKETGDYDHDRLETIKARLDEFREKLEQLKK